MVMIGAAVSDTADDDDPSFDDVFALVGDVQVPTTTNEDEGRKMEEEGRKMKEGRKTKEGT